jgi:hypothetical protein
MLSTRLLIVAALHFMKLLDCSPLAWAGFVGVVLAILGAINLACVGELEGLGKIPSILRRLESDWQTGQMSLFGWDDNEADWTLE